MLTFIFISAVLSYPLLTLPLIVFWASYQIHAHDQCTCENLSSLRTRPRQFEIKDVAITAGYFIIPRKKRELHFPLSATNTLIQSDWDPWFLSLLCLSCVRPMRKPSQTQNHPTKMECSYRAPESMLSLQEANLAFISAQLLEWSVKSRNLCG